MYTLAHKFCVDFHVFGLLSGIVYSDVVKEPFQFNASAVIYERSEVKREGGSSDQFRALNKPLGRSAEVSCTPDKGQPWLRFVEAHSVNVVCLLQQRQRSARLAVLRALEFAFAFPPRQLNKIVSDCFGQLDCLDRHLRKLLAVRLLRPI